MSKSIVIITGASSGIGREFALQLDAHLRKTDEIWLIARREDKLNELSRRLRNNTRILSMDFPTYSLVTRAERNMRMRLKSKPFVCSTI